MGAREKPCPEVWRHGSLRELTAHNCSSCEPYLDLIEDVYAAGGKYDTKGWTVDVAHELEPMEVTAAITMEGGVMSPAAGHPADQYDKARAHFRFRLKPLGEVLAVSFVGLLR